jgi:dihydrofolate reductase
MKKEIGKTELGNVKMPPLTAVVAMALNRVIGVGDKLPWHIPDELKWFKNLTMGHLLLMGRKTFESIGKPLPGRTIVVLSKSGFKHPDVITISDLAELPKVANNQKIFVCGGASIYKLTLPWWSDIFVSLIKTTIPGDVIMPLFESMFELDGQILDHKDFKVIHYRRRT